jgi:2-polyprenyl-3-methyl-5-hydroxy-6-metoxy-1,4-benzoquinol methylase
MATTTSRMGSFYNEKLAASQLRKYREKGPIASTQALIDALKAEGVEGATLLDIGGGIGAIQHELRRSCLHVPGHDFDRLLQWLGGAELDDLRACV